MKISVLGSGCPACKKLHTVVEKVVKDENIDAEVEYSADIRRIVELGLMMSPVLVVDGRPVTIKSTSERDVKEALLTKTEVEDGCSGCSCGGKC